MSASAVEIRTSGGSFSQVDRLSEDFGRAGPVLSYDDIDDRSLSFKFSTHRRALEIQNALVVPLRDVTNEDVSERQTVEHQRFLWLFWVQSWQIVNWYYASCHLVGIFGQVSRILVSDRFLLILPVRRLPACLPGISWHLYSNSIHEIQYKEERIPMETSEDPGRRCTRQHSAMNQIPRNLLALYLSCLLFCCTHLHTPAPRKCDHWWGVKRTLAATS